MGKIKSALELALERAGNIEPARLDVIKNNELKENGKKFAAKFFAGEEMDIEAFLDTFSDDDSFVVIQGMAESSLANIVLPNSNNLDRFLRLKKLLGFFNNSLLDALGQTEEVFNHYIKSKENLVLSLEEHFKDLIKQKEDDYYRQTGVRQKLSLSNVPEALKVYQSEIAKFELSYKEHIDYTKEQIKTLFKLDS